MVGNSRQSRNIYVENDYENIILVDPNKVVLPNGEVEERLVEHENLIFYANLEAKVLPRTKLAVGSDLDDSVINTSVASLGEPGIQEINFLSPSGKLALDTSWSDQQTGKGSREGQGINQMQEYLVGQQPNQKIVRKTINVQDTQGLGITNIKIQNNPAYIPQVTIEMVDVQGRTLFEQGDLSPYSAFFQLPYPIFYLTVKGYYGKAVRYELMLKKFNARFDPSDGNYKITTEYIGRTSAILEDINVQHLFTGPRMYSKQFTKSEDTTATSQQQQEAQSSNVSSTTAVSIQNTTKGRQVLSEVYSQYKAKGLLAEDFEELTLSEFLYRIESLERYINEQFGPQELEVLNDIKNYRDSINTFRNEIFSSTSGSFYNTYIDGSFPIVESKEKGNGYIYYPLKKDIRESTEKTQKANTKLDEIIKKYEEILNKNNTFGTNGSYTIENPDTGKVETNPSQINFLIDVNKIKKEVDSNKIDFEKTFILRKNRQPSEQELVTFTSELIVELNLQVQVVVNGNLQAEKQPYYVFGDTFDDANFPVNTFLSLLDKMELQFSRDEQNIETALSKSLARKITRPASEGGLGFNPTIRNTLGVICANADAFLRLMDDTHTRAYNQRTNPIRLTSIIDPDKNFGTDTKDSVQKVTVDGKLTEDNVVYPWPQYFETELDRQGNSSYVIKYPGDPKSMSKTKGYLYDVWPEIQFVEEYLKGSVQKDIQQNPRGLANPAVESEFIGVSALEFPNTLQPYEDKTETNFLYEIFERAMIASDYTKLFRPSSYGDEIYALMSDFEFHNISESIKDSPSLNITLKNFTFTYDSFLSLLREQSNAGEGELWTNFSEGNFVTPYIIELTNNPVKLYDITVFENTPQITNGPTSTENIVNYLKKTTSNEFTTFDVYPFTNLEWDKSNLANGKTINGVFDSNNTTKTLVFNDEKKTIASFNREDNVYDKTLLTTTYWRGNTGEGSTQNILNFEKFTDGGSTTVGLNQITRDGAKKFYQDKNYENLWITESFVNYGNEYGTSGITEVQTTSLLNTPYFANAISEAVINFSSNEPAKSLGYLLINSLPLATLREKFKSFNDDDVETELDYVWSVMNKFSAIHKVPYAWIVKYGSIWHRYKTYVETGIDILNDVWTDYNYSQGYDPYTSLSTKTYDYINYTGGTSSVTQQFNQTYVGPQVIDQSNMNVGIYPKLINDTYNFFTGQDLFPNISNIDLENAYNKKLYIGKLNSSQINFGLGFDTNNPNRILYLNNYFEYMDLQANPDIQNSPIQDKKVLMYPSCGFLPFNQSKFECTNTSNNLTQELTGNTSVYNGSVRSLWLSPNYGYYNNKLIRKPEYNEYLKQIFTGDSKQNSFSLESDNQYSSIEEIFSVFDKETLDIFETEFLNFCKNSNDGINLMDGESNNSSFFNLENATNRRYRNIQYLMSDIMCISSDFTKTDNPEKDSFKLASLQMDGVVNSIKDFLNYNVVLKLGNVSKYNRRVFGSFAGTITQNPIVFGNYVPGTLPGDGTNVTLLTSQTSLPDVWQTLEEYVGFSTISGLTYTNNGSYITDFFIDNNITFSNENIISLSQLIKIYANQKLQNTTITSGVFKTTIQNLLTSQQTFRENVLNSTFTQLRVKLPTYTESDSNSTLSVIDGEQPKLEVYTTLKNLNDKWIAGGNFKTRTLFEDFLFLDRANRDIGDSFTIDIISLKSYLKGKVASFSLMSLIGYILSQNNFIFMALPSYVNFYGIQQASKNGTPTVNPDIANSAFGTYLSVDYQDSKPKFLCMYVGKPSEHLDMKENKTSRFKTDTFDLRRGSNNPLLENQSNKTDWSKSNKVVGFNLDFGIRNQNIFKSISLDQNQYKNTSETFQVLSDMANQASGDKVAQQSTSLYNIYRTRSYTCSVSSMGNMMIQPTMYFNLRHVPMFYGPYFITNVSHDITINGFETSFEGIRQPIFAFPSIDKLVTSVNKSLLKKYGDVYRKKKGLPKSENSTNQVNNSVTTNPLTPSESENCNDTTLYPSLVFVDFTNTRIPVNDVINYLNSIINYNEYLRIYALGSATYINSGLGSLDCVNNNLYGISSNTDIWVNLTGFTSGQVCVDKNNVSKPIFAFEDFKNSINFFIEVYINYVSIIENLIRLDVTSRTDDEKIAKALTYLYLSTWANNYGFRNTANNIKTTTDQNISNNTISQQTFDKIYEKMFSASIKIL